MIPDSKSLDAMVLRLQRLQEIVDRRSTYCDRGMRLLSASRRTRMDFERGREDERRRKEAEDEEKERRANKKKKKATEALASQESNIGPSPAFSSGVFLSHPFPRAN